MSYQGGWLPPPYGLSPAAKKFKRKWPRASRTSLLHPLQSFWWKKPGGTPLRWGKVELSKFEGKGGGWLPPQNILSRHFEKYLHGMVLKLSGHVRNTVSLLYMQKTRWNSDIWNFLSEKMDFLSILVYVHWKSAFETGHVWKRHCDVIHWLIFMILVSMKRGDPTLNHGTKQTYFGPVKFKFIRGVVTTPLVNHVTKKGLVGRGLGLAKLLFRMWDSYYRIIALITTPLLIIHLSKRIWITYWWHTYSSHNRLLGMNNSFQ